MSDQKGKPERRTEFLEICFDTFCAYGLENTGMKKLSEACGVTNGTLVYYFGSKDNLIVEATAYRMAKVEDDFMERAPTSFEDIGRFLREMPYITAKLHGANTGLCIRYMPAHSIRNMAKSSLKGSAGVTASMPRACRRSWGCRRLCLCVIKK